MTTNRKSIVLYGADDRPLARPAQRVAIARRDLRARVDVAEATDDNRRLWAGASGASADAMLNSETRRRLRERARYEVLNNSYAKGIGLTIANDTIGSGPQLQMLGKNKRINTLIETLFWEWACETRFAEKLRQLRFARYDSGEAFALWGSNPRLDSPVKLDVRIHESEEIADPAFMPDDDHVDGILFDQWGNRIAYHILDVHPGSTTWTIPGTSGRDVPARWVFHYYLACRPGQSRGIPDVTPALQLFAELRRYCAAVIAAAETAADFAAVVHSDAPPDPDAGDAGEAPETWDLVELQKRMGTVLPQGWKLTQLQAEQPTSTYSDFVNAKLREIGRCLNVPFTIASMDSSISNMSSAYIDRQVYAHNRMIDRADLEIFLNRLFDAWLEEAIRSGVVAERQAYPHQWFWPSLGHHADPAKVANAAREKLKVGLTNLPLEFAKDGLDWEEQERSAAESYGITVEQYREKLCGNIFGPAKPATPAPVEPEAEEEMAETRGEP